MRKLKATGHDDRIPEDVPTLYVSHGRGNSGESEVHLHFFDSALDQEVAGWINKADLLAAINEGATA